MREIKFRAWDTEKEIMVRVEHIGFNDLEVTVQDEDCNCWRSVYPYVCKLMQYTGLNDSNGKEIYEGDIVEIDDYFGENIIGRVIYDETYACYWFMKGDERNHFKMTFDLESYVHTIIGNIYENPELLGGTENE